MQNAEPRPHRPLGVVFMRHGVAKIDQHTIAEVLSNIAVILVNHRGTGLVVGPHDLPQVFRVQVPRQRGRVNQIAEQHGEVAAFCLRRRQQRLGYGRGHRAGRPRHLLGVRRDGRHKAIAPPVHGGNEAGRLRRVAQGPA